MRLNSQCYLLLLLHKKYKRGVYSIQPFSLGSMKPAPVSKLCLVTLTTFPHAASVVVLITLLCNYVFIFF